MKLLWAVPDRSKQVLDSFYSLMMASGEHCELTVLTRPMDCLEIDMCVASVKNGIHPPQILDPDYCNTFDWLLVDAPHIFFGENWSAITAKKAMTFGDVHGGMVDAIMHKFHGEFGFDLFLPIYRDATLGFHPYLAEKTVWLPLWCDTRYFQDWGCQEKEYEVLLTGVVHPGIYPWRQAVLDQCQGKPWFTHIERPTESAIHGGKPWPIREDFGKVLNAAKICPTCTSCYHYTIGKTVEIPGSHSVMACDSTPEMEEMGWIPDQNFLLLKEEDHNNLAVTFESWLQRDDLGQIAEAGYQLVHTKHSDKVRAKQLVRLLENF